MKKPKSRGMINGKDNILGYPCKDINRTVPYFEQIEKSKFSDTNDYLTKTIDLLHD
jgi:hypothetical protein